MNRALCAMLGRTRDELLATGVAALTHPEDRAQEAALLRQLLARSIDFHVLEKRYLHRDGGAIWVKLTSSLTGDPDAPDTHRLSLVEDITAWKQAQLAERRWTETFEQRVTEKTRELSEANDWFRRERNRYFEISCDLLTISDFEGMFRDFNRAVMEQTGKTREDLIGTPMVAFVHPDDRAVAMTGHQRPVAGAPVAENEFRIRYSDGSWHWTAWKAVPVPSERLIYGVGRDIHRQRALEQERNRYFELSRDMLLISDFDGTFRDVNRAILEHTGKMREELIGTRMREFVHPDDRAVALAEYQRLIDGAPVCEVEFRLRHCDGTWHWTAWKAVAVPGERLIYGVGRDIQRQRTLEEERNRYFELSRDMLIITGFDGIFRDVNRVALEQSRMTREELLSTHLITFVHPDDQETVMADLERMNAGEPITREIRIRHRDGSWRWMAWNSTPISSEGVIYTVGRDIQDQRETEEALRRAQRMEALGQLTGGIAHDFNNLLTSVIGNLDLLLRRAPADDRYRPLAEAALQAAERGAHLTQRLLAFGRRQRLSPAVVNVNELLGEMEIVYRRALGETVRLSLDLQEALWPCRVDRAQFEAAILNLVLNARDALPQGGLVTIGTQSATVRPGEIAELAPGDYVRVTVRDNGAGMAPEVASRAFEPFFTTKEVGKGSGLGLSTVYGFATQSGGTARIESVPGSGTAVHLYLPRSPEPPPRPHSPAEQPGIGVARRATILVVEDEDAVRQVTTAMLEEAGHHVLAARDAAEALAILRRDRPVELLISDIVMPGGMSGVELADEARRLDPKQRILLVTGYPSKHLDEALSTFGLAVMTKPYRPRELAAKVDEMLGAD